MKSYYLYLFSLLLLLLLPYLSFGDRDTNRDNNNILCDVISPENPLFQEVITTFNAYAQDQYLLPPNLYVACPSSYPLIITSSFITSSLTITIFIVTSSSPY